LNLQLILRLDILLPALSVLGDERQQMTEAQPMATSRNVPFTSSSNAYASDFPSMIRANASLVSLDWEISDFPSFI
ncbi:hypothetical protein, partial [Plesiomonas shigelloides]|uniref:hypothetical protein n=1 Tax=Plesiomonas shigelloides TaxID=703 RepID=UPI000561A798